MKTLEKIATAIQTEAGTWPNESFDRIFTYAHRHVLARAAVTAMLEPSETLLDEFADAYLTEKQNGMRDQMRRRGKPLSFPRDWLPPTWRAAIQSILDGKA